MGNKLISLFTLENSRLRVSLELHETEIIFEVFARSTDSLASVGKR